MGGNLIDLAKKIVYESLGVERGHKVYINLSGSANELAENVIRQIYHAGGVPFIRCMPVSILKEMLLECTEEQLRQWSRQELRLMKSMNAYLSLSAEDNVYEMNDVPAEKYQLYERVYLLPQQQMMAGIKNWLIHKYPTFGTAQLAMMSNDSFRNIYFDSCMLDYDKLRQYSEPLQRRLAHTDKVRIISPSTDLSFSIRGMSNFFCGGKYNLPDGELFTAPHMDSVEGTIMFNVPSPYRGYVFQSVRLVFHRGRVIEAECNDTERLWEILNTDEDSLRVGEFGIGLNPRIRRAMNSIIFDEKMSGSIHLALGHAYEMADNGNRSNLHWDLVLCQLDPFGGELYFDNTLIRRNGEFVPPDLVRLNQL